VISSPQIVEIAGVTKRFPGVLALDRIHVRFRAGEVHAVVGENGAGKSTLMHILAGDLQPSEGEILVDGKPTHFASPLCSRAIGVVVVYQELALCPTMTVAENVAMSDMARRRFASLVPRAMMRAEARAALERLGMDSLDPDTRVSRLSVAEMQLVEIARAVRQRARLLVLDEPNSALSRRDSERLFDVVRQLRAEGVTVIYVSHRLGEVLDLADRVTIMRDGRTIETLDNEDLSELGLIRSVVGRDLGDVPPWRVNPTARSEGNPVVLSVTDLKATGLAEISFEVRADEILGVGGLPDSGKDGLGEALFGLCPREGRVAIDGAEAPADALASIRNGMAFVPADRRGAGGLLAMTVADNGRIGVAP
jgi:ribose transport system ATP-binding protein